LQPYYRTILIGNLYLFYVFMLKDLPFWYLDVKRSVVKSNHLTRLHTLFVAFFPYVFIIYDKLDIVSLYKEFVWKGSVVLNKVKDYMLTDVIYVQKNDTLRHLLTVFIDNQIASVPVVDETMRLQGMISDGDVFQTLTPMDREIGMIYSFAYTIPEPEARDVIHAEIEKPVKKVMTKKKLLYLQEEDDIKDVFTILSKHPVKKIPVVDEEKRVVGVINR